MSQSENISLNIFPKKFLKTSIGLNDKGNNIEFIVEANTELPTLAKYIFASQPGQYIGIYVGEYNNKNQNKLIYYIDKNIITINDKIELSIYIDECGIMTINNLSETLNVAYYEI